MGAPIIINEQRTSTDLIRMLISEYMSDLDILNSMRYFDRTYTFSTIFDINSPTLDLNFSDFGWESSRWDKFCRQYLDLNFLEWLRRLDKTPKSAETGYSFKTAGHDHGNCVVHLSFHPSPEPMLTMYSRISNLVPTSILELSVANLVATSLLERFNQSVRIRWMASQIQFSPLWGFYYLHHGFTPEEKSKWGSGKSVKEYLKLEERFKRYCEGTFIPPYGREKNLYKRATMKFRHWTPTYFLIDEKRYPLNVGNIFDYGIPSQQDQITEFEDDDEDS